MTLTLSLTDGDVAMINRLSSELDGVRKGLDDLRQVDRFWGAEILDNSGHRVTVCNSGLTNRELHRLHESHERYRKILIDFGALAAVLLGNLR